MEEQNTENINNIAEDLSNFFVDKDAVQDKEVVEEKGLSTEVYELMTFIDDFEADKENRQYTDWAWYVYDNYVKGNHFVKYNDITQVVEAVPTGNHSRFAINKIWSTLRSVRGFVTKYDPKWYVYPENVSNEAIKQAQAKQKLLDDRWLFGDLKVKTKQNVFQGLKYSVGILEIIWNAETQEVEYQVADPYGIYFGGPSYPNCTRITKTCWRTLDDIENDEQYKAKKGDIVEGLEQYTSMWKQTLEDNMDGHKTVANSDKGTIVYETHYYTAKKNKLGGHVNIATFTKDSFLRHIATSIESLWDTFHIYKTDDDFGQNYGEGWVKNLIPPQKLLNILESETADYHHTFAKGRYVVAKNSGTKIITNENGTILEHNPGRRPIVENAPSMAASVDNQIQRANIYLEDIGGQHDASLGRIPTGASAGVAIEALQEGDANNLKDLVDNYKTFLTGISYGTLNMYARKLKSTKLIATDDKNKDGKPDFFAIIGEDATDIPDTIEFQGVEVPVYVIRKKEKIRVTIDSWLAFTREAREARIYKHYTAGMISRRAALEALQYNDVDQILEDAIKEEVVAKMLKESQGPQPEGQGQLPVEEKDTPPPETETAGAISQDAGIPMPQ